MRILDQSKVMIELEQLGMLPQALERFTKAFAAVIQRWPSVFGGSDLDPDANRKKMETIVQRIEALAVALMFSFLNADHERQLGARLRAALPGLPIYLSCEILPEIKEFERTSTTAVCAYVGPILASYLARLEEVTRSLGLPPLYVMASNGGILEAREAVAMPAVVVESGPAAGVVAAALVARQPNWA